MNHQVEDLQKITEVLDKHHIFYVLGGSGLLYALGIAAYHELGELGHHYRSTAKRFNRSVVFF